MVRFTAILAAALLLPGCDDGNAGKGGKGGGTEDVEVDETPFLRKFPPSTTGGPAEAMRAVIKDQGVWAELWAKANAHIAPVPKAPTVDFSKEMVAFAGLGTKPTAGYSVEIVGTSKEEAGKLVLFFVERAPAAGSAAAAVLTAPWHAVVLERTDLNVEWRAYEAPVAKPR